jgi:hypothetical protein
MRPRLRWSHTKFDEPLWLDGPANLISRILCSAPPGIAPAGSTARVLTYVNGGC